MSNLLLTPEEAAQLTGLDLAGNNRPLIDVNTILVAQLALLQPALGSDLYDALGEGSYQQFVANYLKLPLSLWIKALLLQTSILRLGSMGAVKASAQYIKPASERDIALAVNVLRSQARMLLRGALDHLAANRNDYPEYKPLPRRLLRRLDGGIIL
ncbi:MAG: hypothetical protein LBH06_09375 [Rikenellaceae bacterium]|jgi:hypothetical protein|nr:hypothetical protein [Rikenellaceae bacterium]